MNGTFSRLPRWFVAVIALVPTYLSAAATTADGPTIHYVSALEPAQGLRRELAVDRAPTTRSAARPGLRNPGPAGAHPWQLQASLPGTVIKDIAFPSAQVGYIAAELGKVLKTTDGGTTWTEVLNLQFPYYWYGIHAFSEQDVVISGFDNSNWRGLIRWSHDGGATWSDDVVLSTDGWSYRVRFADDQRGLVVDGIDISNPNTVHYTSNGGATAGDWTTVVIDSNPATAGWWGNQFSLLPSGRARGAGTNYCDSPDAGATWTCGPSIDSTFGGPFDGATFFFDDSNGWVGGGTISPEVRGWLHRTTDGGATWTDRTLDVPQPIREILFADPQNGWAVGGDMWSGVGAMYFSDDGGQTWSLDLDTGSYEMGACDRVDRYIWCAGVNSAFTGVVYKLEFAAPTPVAGVNPNPLSFAVAADGTASSALTISNTGSGTLTYSIAESPAKVPLTSRTPGSGESGTGGCSATADVPWLTETPASGSVAGGASEEVTVSVDTAGMAEGTHSALLCVTTNDPSNPQIEVPVDLTVSGVADRIFADGFDAP